MPDVSVDDPRSFLVADADVPGIGGVVRVLALSA